MPNPTHARGFTLIEIMVALFIFAIMSVMSYRGLTAVLDSRDHLAQENRKWREVALTFARLDQDLSAALNRPVRDANGLVAASLVGKTELLGEDDAQLLFTRIGPYGQGGGLSAPQRCGYRLRGKLLEQLVWPSADAAPRALPNVNTVMADVAKIEFRYLDTAGLWETRWPQPGKNQALPSAVEVVVELGNGERVTRLFALPAS